MKKEAHTPTQLSRRHFLATTGAVLAASILPEGSARGQATSAKYRRLNVTNPKAPLDSYRKAITAMLKLPPADPRNWYRNALIHTMDCPHGNWWFVPWHRGYIGWFERTCRELSGDPAFAFPYWDWTALPRIPEPFFEGVLNPDNDAFIGSLEEFEKQFKNPMSDLWKTFTQDQIKQLNARGFNSVNDLWSAIEDGMFFPQGQSRTLTQAAPFFDAVTRRAVSLSTIRAALRPTDFLDFGSAKVPQHSASGPQGILESQPHNNVHNNVGGFMSDLLSPVDPIFFMHHSNIDRLWDVWTRKQESIGKSPLPTDPNDLAKWKKEPFLFFIDPQGKPVSKNTAGDYATIGDFDYDYEPGSADRPQFRPSPFVNKVWAANLMAKTSELRQSVQGIVTLPDQLEEAAVAEEGPALVARVTLKPGVETDGVQFHVMVNPPEGVGQVGFNNPSFAGSFTVFGKRRGEHAGQPVSFTVPLDEAVKKLRDAKRLEPGKDLKIQVVAQRKGVALAPLDLNVADISVGAL